MFAIVETIKVWWRQFWCPHESYMFGDGHHPDYCDDCGKLRPKWPSR
jgi:hypothetical protein